VGGGGGDGAVGPGGVRVERGGPGGCEAGKMHRMWGGRRRGIGPAPRYWERSGGAGAAVEVGAGARGLKGRRRAGYEGRGEGREAAAGRNTGQAAAAARRPDRPARGAGRALPPPGRVPTPRRWEVPPMAATLSRSRERLSGTAAAVSLPSSASISSGSSFWGGGAGGGEGEGRGQGALGEASVFVGEG
jgi:hypothetical protein